MARHSIGGLRVAKRPLRAAASRLLSGFCALPSGVKVKKDNERRRKETFYQKSKRMVEFDDEDEVL